MRFFSDQNITIAITFEFLVSQIMFSLLTTNFDLNPCLRFDLSSQYHSNIHLYQCKLFYADNQILSMRLNISLTRDVSKISFMYLMRKRILQKNVESISVAAIMTSLFVSILTKLLLNFAISQGITNSL